MPIEILREGEILLIVYSGTVTQPELVEMTGRLAKVEDEMERVPNRLADLTRLTHPAVTFTDVLAFANQRRGLRFRNAFRSAVLAHGPVATGFAQMWQALNDHPQISIEIFTDRDAALKWLAEDPRAVTAPTAR
jgi:hypothetical protein